MNSAKNRGRTQVLRKQEQDENYSSSFSMKSLKFILASNEYH